MKLIRKNFEAIETANERVLEKANRRRRTERYGYDRRSATVVENYLYVANVGRQQTVSDTGITSDRSPETILW